MKYLIWSEEHGAWWLPASRGYTRQLAEAGRYDLVDAAVIVQRESHHVPEGLPFAEVIVADPMPFNASILGKPDEVQSENERKDNSV